MHVLREGGGEFSPLGLNWRGSGSGLLFLNKDQMHKIGHVIKETAIQGAQTDI